MYGYLVVSVLYKISVSIVLLYRDKLLDCVVVIRELIRLYRQYVMRARH